MAFIFERRGSPFYWLSYKTPDGKRARESTQCRIGVPTDVRRARIMAADKSLEEAKAAPVSAASDNWDWVPPFLKIRYHARPATLERYSCAWPTILMYLKEKEILGPAQLLRDHCFNYVTWRQKPNKSQGKYKACHNTALLELKILRIIMQEAVERGFAQGNPVLRLGIEKEPRKLKPELSDEDCDFIRSKFVNVTDEQIRHMLTVSFEIGRYQGCRLKETRLDLRKDVDFKAQTIRWQVKGGKSFTTILHPKLIPLFERLIAESRITTWDTPKGSPRQWAAAKWAKFLDGQGIKKKLGDAVCFHCTRVTVATRLVRNNVPTSKAKNYLGHSSTLMTELYQRLQPEDLSGCVEAVG